MILFFKRLKAQPRSCTNGARSTPITAENGVSNLAAPQSAPSMPSEDWVVKVHGQYSSLQYGRQSADDWNRALHEGHQFGMSGRGDVHVQLPFCVQVMLAEHVEISV
jgi:hypothetical protein